MKEVFRTVGDDMVQNWRPIYINFVLSCVFITCVLESVILNLLGWESSYIVVVVRKTICINI